ncbi:MAG: carbon storage regulator CsrA [Porticoccus sp.]|jgi:carbon storage regulator CsrA
MSILTLSIDQTLMIADHVTVTILEIDGSQICIGINAPEEVSVDLEAQSHQKIQETEAIAGQSNRR